MKEALDQESLDIFIPDRVKVPAERLGNVKTTKSGSKDEYFRLRRKRLFSSQRKEVSVTALL